MSSETKIYDGLSVLGEIYEKPSGRITRTIINEGLDCETYQLVRATEFISGSCVAWADKDKHLVRNAFPDEEIAGACDHVITVALPVNALFWIRLTSERPIARVVEETQQDRSNQVHLQSADIGPTLCPD